MALYQNTVWIDTVDAERLQHAMYHQTARILVQWTLFDHTHMPSTDVPIDRLRGGA